MMIKLGYTPLASLAVVGPSNLAICRAPYHTTHTVCAAIRPSNIFHAIQVFVLKQRLVTSSG